MKGFLFILALVMLAGCTKSIPVKLTDYNERKLVVEGKITDVNTIQEFKITWTANLGAATIENADDAKLSVGTPAGPVDFIHTGKGVYQSAVPFAGIPGEMYTISFSREEITHSVHTRMPGNVSIDSFKMASTYGLPYDRSPSIFLTLSSDQEQYFRYDLFRLKKEDFPDSVWTNIEIPVYEAFKVNPGQQQVTMKPIYTNLYLFDSTDVVKIFVYSLSEDVYLYLDKLRKFMTAEPKGGKYENPPYYYSNEAYGLGYGTSVDSAYFLLD